MPLTVLHSPEEWKARFGAASRTALSVGNFDGLHLGHQKILQSVRERARANSQQAAVVTFDPHPLRLLRPDQAPRMIQTLAQRLAGFERMGLDAALVLRFDRALSLVSPEDFIQRILVDCLHVGTILVGANFCFGHRGAGDVRLLAEFGKVRGFDVEIVPPVEIQGQVVSSTAIRNAIESWECCRRHRIARPSVFAHGRNSARAPGEAGRSCSLRSISFRSRNCFQNLGSMRRNPS